MKPPDKVKFYYLKANEFRVVHMDGVVGGLSPTGDIYMSVFSQRPPIPQVTVQSVKEDGQLGEEIISERLIKDGIVREIEVGITFRPETAEIVIKWLQEKVAEYNGLKTQKAEPERKHA